MVEVVHRASAADDDAMPSQTAPEGFRTNESRDGTPPRASMMLSLRGGLPWSVQRVPPAGGDSFD
jgi:hypothetical protein